MAVVAYSAGGELLWEADRGGPAWQATLFGAAQDAAQGQMWRSEQNWWQRWDARRRRTQGRRLEMAGRLTGVSGGLKEREREQIATRLGVATMTVLSDARRWGRSWQSRGAAIVAVLWWRWPAARRWGDRMGAAGAVSAICGGHRARGWWRAGSSNGKYRVMWSWIQQVLALPGFPGGSSPHDRKFGRDPRSPPLPPQTLPVPPRPDLATRKGGLTTIAIHLYGVDLTVQWIGVTSIPSGSHLATWLLDSINAFYYSTASASSS